jgi:uncharacterized Zn-binding protein involved in type VI secretion
MPPAARFPAFTDHPGVVVGPGAPTVLINGQPAAVVNDRHICLQPSPAGPPAHPPGDMLSGSTTVFIGGRPALRVGDRAVCGAAIAFGAPNVSIGG